MNPSNTTNQQDMNQTPSPSDSAVGDLETMLKEKDTEINYLRETMEQNEQVIFKVSHPRGGGGGGWMVGGAPPPFW